MKNNFISINHIDNEATHHGLDENLKFLIKTKKALQNLYYLNSNKLIGQNDIIPAINTGTVIGAIFTANSINLFSNSIESNLMGSKPNLLLFDLYRLSYLCSLK